MTDNENLHEGAAKGFAMAGEVVGFAGHSGRKMKPPGRAGRSES